MPISIAAQMERDSCNWESRNYYKVTIKAYRGFLGVGGGGDGALQSDLGLVSFCGMILGKVQGLVRFQGQRPQRLVGFCAQGLLGF